MRQRAREQAARAAKPAKPKTAAASTRSKATARSTAKVKAPTGKTRAAKKPAPPARDRGGVAAAVRRDLKALDEQLATSALAATALALAAEIDAAGSSPSEKATCARALTEVMTRLRELQPPESDPDGLDELEARRANRLGGRAAAKK